MEQVLRHESVRKLLHLPAFAFPLIALYSKTIAIAMLMVLATGYLLITYLERKRGIRTPLVSALISHCKRSGTNDGGPFYLALGMAIALYISEPLQAFFAAYVIAISDGLASLVGMRLGKHTIPLFGKSYIGSLVFFSTCFLGALYYLSPIGAIITAACLTAVELVSTRGLDNLTLPIASQLLLLFFM